MHATPSPIKKNGSFAKSPSRKSDHKNVGQNKAKGEPTSSKNDSKSSPQLKCLPQARVRHIMECSPGGEDLKMSEDGVIAMAKAAEGFIELLARGAYEETSGVSVNYNHLSNYVHSNEEFDFIQDILPRKERFSEIMKLMKKHKNAQI
uniref:Transcription factor CBF/NF-Y/archaeal histone domain-containing protein n=1 Tax=Meloidogyne floridensis TaxID=298350 RepID=A0A915NYR5_9BILA